MTDNNESKPATLDDVVAAVQRNQEILEDIATWIKIGNVENVKKILNSALKTAEEKNVYHLSDGKTTREINSMCGVSIGTISKHWKTWYKLGLMKTISVKRGDRFIKKFNLEDFGIDIPAGPSKKEPEQIVSSSEQSTITNTTLGVDNT